MAWALYLSNTSAASVTDEQLAELDDYELVSRTGIEARSDHLSRRIGHIVYALVCAAGAFNSRTQMLRSVSALQSLLTNIDADLLQTAVRGLVTAYLADPRSSVPPDLEDPDSPFLRPLVNIAVNRVSDAELSTTAAHSLAILLGCPSFDSNADNAIPLQISKQADIQTRRLIAMLITEVMLTSSPRALAALSHLLRRDAARLAFCERDGVSTLASTLQTQPGKIHTAIGELVATTIEFNNVDPVYASYHAVFSVWMLTFASQSHVIDLVLRNVISSRLVVVLARLLNHSSEQSFKIARVTLASVRNMATGDTVLHQRIRRDLLAADAPSVLARLMRMASAQGSLMGNDDDVLADAQALLSVLETEKESMSTLDAYIAEVQADTLHWSPVHKDRGFWNTHTETILEQFRDILKLLADIVMNEKASSEERIIACSDLASLARESNSGRRAVLSILGLKACLMELMVVTPDPDLKSAALLCVQHLLLNRILRQT